MEGEQAAGKRNPWITHVKKTLKANKGKSFKAVLKMAKKTYKGGAEPSEAPSAASTASPVGGRRRGTRKATRKGKKGSRKH